MPLTFPSHPGLILPLWAFRPRRYDALALTVGSMAPDVLDTILELPIGNSSLNFSHSLVGLVTACIPLTFATLLAGEPVLRRLLRFARGMPSMGSWLGRLVARPLVPQRVLASVALGAGSHLVFDALSKRHIDWFLPWRRPDLLHPALAGPWMGLWYRGHSRPGLELDFFELLWVGWSILGAILFAVCWQTRVRHAETWR